MKIKFTTIFLLIILTSSLLRAQQEPLFTQYYINDMFINPAVAGTKMYNAFFMQTRQQWLGFEGAPLTTNISYHGALNNRSGMGGYLMFDQTYPALNGNLNVNYAYRIPLNRENFYLSFGLGAKLMYHSIDFNQGELPPGQDYAFSASSYNKLLADASTGLFLYGKNLYLGISSSNLLQSSFNVPVNEQFPNFEIRNYYAMCAYRLRIINNDWHIEPSFLVRKAHNFSSVTDLTTRIIYLKDTWSGLSYRTDGTLVFSFGFGSGTTHFSYSYDHTFKGDIQKHSYGTHELGISLRLETLVTQRRVDFWEY